MFFADLKIIKMGLSFENFKSDFSEILLGKIFINR